MDAIVVIMLPSLTPLNQSREKNIQVKGHTAYVVEEGEKPRMSKNPL